MSRIGKKAVKIPDGVKAEISGNNIKISGPRGDLNYNFRSEVKVEVGDGNITLSLNSDTPESKAYWGLTRSLIFNMVEGVTKGFKKELELSGIGFRASMKDKNLVLLIGYSHPVEYKPRNGVEISVSDNTKISVSGIDKYQVSQAAAEIRKIRPPEPYKGKGIKYVDEIIRKKAGKAGKVGGGGLGE